MSKRCQNVKKMSNVKKSNTQTMEEVHKKKKIHIMRFTHMGHSQKGGDNFEKCSVKIIAKLILSTNYIFRTRL